jgi:hypothetical protein
MNFDSCRRYGICGSSWPQSPWSTCHCNATRTKMATLAGSRKKRRDTCVTSDRTTTVHLDILVEEEEVDGLRPIFWCASAETAFFRSKSLCTGRWSNFRASSPSFRAQTHSKSTNTCPFPSTFAAPYALMHPLDRPHAHATLRLPAPARSFGRPWRGIRNDVGGSDSEVREE